MRNILVPTDFSAESHNALEVALQLATRTGGQLTLLHVVDASSSGGMVTTGGRSGSGDLHDLFMVQLLQVTKRRMHRLMAEVAELAPDVLVHDIVETGNVDEAVLEVTQRNGIDLIVVGAHEHAPVSYLFGTDSHAERLVRLAPCPVLTVKHPAPAFEAQAIVFASDFAREAESVLPTLLELLGAFPKAKLVLLDIEGSAAGQKAALERITAFAQRYELTQYEPVVYDDARVRTGIPRYMAEVQADLVVMLTHGHTGLWHLLQGGTAESVAVQTSAPVLTFHAA